jgi:hypothetical protein
MWGPVVLSAGCCSGPDGVQTVALQIDRHSSRRWSDQDQSAIIWGLGRQLLKQSCIGAPVSLTHFTIKCLIER